MANAGLYYGHKIKAATCYSLYQRTKNAEFHVRAIRHMERAREGWETYIEIFRRQYTHGRLSIINRDCDFDALQEDVRRDVILVGGNPD